jgi:iron complex outermembrane receptor protein
VTDQLTVNAMYSYIDAKYKEWMVANGAGLVNIAPKHRVPEHAEELGQPRRQLRLADDHVRPQRFDEPSMNSLSYKSKVYQTEIAALPPAWPAWTPVVPGNLMLAQSGYSLWDAGLVWTSSRPQDPGRPARPQPDRQALQVAGYNFSGFFNTVTASTATHAPEVLSCANKKGVR